MLLTSTTSPTDTTTTSTIRMKPLVGREAMAAVEPAGPPEVSIYKTAVAPHPSSAGATPPCLPLGYCPAPRPAPGHPREGQQASLLGGKYLLLEALEGSSLHRCLHIPTQEELVCKVGKTLPPPSFFLLFCTAVRRPVIFLCCSSPANSPSPSRHFRPPSSTSSALVVGISLQEGKC